MKWLHDRINCLGNLFGKHSGTDGISRFQHSELDVKGLLHNQGDLTVQGMNHTHAPPVINKAVRDS